MARQERLVIAQRGADLLALGVVEAPERADLTDEMRANVLRGAAERFYGHSLVP